MKQILKISQIVIALLLIGTVLIQSKGTGLGASLGREGESYRTKRGAEKILSIATIVFAALFLLNSIANILLE